MTRIVMKQLPTRRLVIGAIVLALAGAAAGTAYATSEGGGTQTTPKGWNYDIKDGKRVPKAGNRVTNADGSWREVTKRGSCTTTKESSAKGEVKTTRSCD
jgi:hypothetical protein